MALPSSGPLSFSQIGAALCTPQSAPYSLRSMSAAAGFSTPDSVSEFYGYSCVKYVEITNNTSTANITNVTVNGVAIDAITFPVSPGNFASGTTNQLGSSYSVVISYNSASGDYVSIYDTELNYNCATATGTSRTFGGQITNGTYSSIQIIMGDGPCP